MARRKEEIARRKEEMGREGGIESRRTIRERWFFDSGSHAGGRAFRPRKGISPALVRGTALGDQAARGGSGTEERSLMRSRRGVSL